MRKKGTYRKVTCCKLSLNETKRDSKLASELHRYYRPRKRTCRSLIQFYPVWLLHFPQWKTVFLRIIISVKTGFSRDILGVSNIKLLQSLLIVSMIPLFSDRKRKLNKWKIHRIVRAMKFTWCMHDCRVLRNSLHDKLEPRSSPPRYIIHRHLVNGFVKEKNLQKNQFTLQTEEYNYIVMAADNVSSQTTTGQPHLAKQDLTKLVKIVFRLLQTITCSSKYSVQ